MAGATSENVSAGSTGNKTVSFAITSGDSGWTAWLVRIPKEPDASPPVSSTPHVKIRGGVGITTITPGTGTEFSDPDGSGTDNFSVEVAAGSNKVLFVAVAYQGTSISITYDGVSMTQLWEDTDGANAQHSTGWILVNPSTGVNTLAITWTGAILAGFAQPWYGVAQGGTEGTTWRAPTTAYDGGSGSGTASVTASNAVAGDMVLDVLAVYGENPTADASQTVQNEQNGPYSTTLNYGTSNKLATGATTMQWTMPSNFWTIGAVPLIPASSGSIISPVKIRGGGGGGVKFR
jgi:hypothetical protein